MRVLLDGQSFRQRRGGISRYFASLLAEFRSHPELGIEAITPFRYVNNDFLLDLDPVRYKRPWVSDSSVSLMAFTILNQMRPRRSVHPEIVHHTGYSAKYLRVGEGVRRVSTVHDMIPELFPHYFGRSNPHLDKQKFVESSDAVLCVSESTRKDLLRIFGPPRGEVFVTPLGVSPRFSPHATKPRWTPEEYLLFVGHRQGYKGFPTLLNAFSRVARHHTELQLVCVGGTPFDAEEVAAIDGSGLANRLSQQVVDDAELPGLYASARAFVFPSLYEGFGLPVLEAFACGCPALLADIPCFREVADEAALFFPASDPTALADLIEHILVDQVLRAATVRRGLLRAKVFPWHRTARLTAEAYGEILQ